MTVITERKMRVTVLGAGIIGATSAFRLKQKFPECEMRLVAGELSPHTTSDIAAGYWEPHLDPDTDPALVTSWSGQTYSMLADLASGRTVDSLGSLGPEMRKTVRRVHGTTVDSEELGRPAWAGEVAQYRDLSARDIEILGLASPLPGKQIFAASFLSFTWETGKALPLFYWWLEQHGVIITQRKVSSIAELQADIIINCTGLGSRDLLGDERMFPVSGHVCRVRAGWVGDVMADNREQTWAYVIPNTETTVLGSVDIQGNWDTRPGREDREKILERCDKLFPGIKVRRLSPTPLNIILLQHCPVVSEKVGLRPCRKGGVRCELEVIQDKKVIN